MKFENSFEEYMIYEILRKQMNPYYSCIKYKIPADPDNDGTDHFIVAESMKFNFTKFDTQSWNPHSLCHIVFITRT